MSVRKKIVMLPLDERPCNYVFPAKLLEDTEYALVLPPAEILGRKKRPADTAAVSAFLWENADAERMVVSLDMLLYGGLLPGRLHGFTEAELAGRLSILKRLKERNPRLTIYAFHLIMRCPQYTSNDEEPDYYGICGREIYLLGEHLHKQRLGILRDDEREALARCKRMTVGCIDDYTARRAVNLRMNCRAVDLAGGVIDYLVVPQDDSSVYGFSAEDRAAVCRHIRAQGKQASVAVYPGADEVGLTLLARAIARDKGVSPTVRVFYSASAAPRLIPKYEDRMLGESVERQIIAAGGTPSEGEADLTLAVNAPSGNMIEADAQAEAGDEYTVARDLPAFARTIAELIKKGQRVGVADVAFGNGGDLQLAGMLDAAGAAMKLAAYGGWNTAGNTLGTALAQMILYRFYGDTAAHRRFLALRYYEDVAFCACARKHVTQSLTEMGLNWRDLKEKENDVAARVGEDVETALRRIMPSVASAYAVTGCRMPWNRMFETELTVHER